MKSKVFSKVVVLFVLLLSVVSFMVFPVFAEDLGSWSVKGDLLSTRSGHIAAEVNRKIYILGGRLNSSTIATASEEYDPATNASVSKASIPTSREYLCGAVIDNKIYAVGGYANGVDSNVLEVYDPTANTWETKTSMPTARQLAGAAAVNGKLYVIGGYHSGTYYNVVEEYNPATNTWTTKASMSTPRVAAGVVAYNGKIYVIGGGNSSGKLKSVEVYDPINNTWTSKTDMPTARWCFGITVLNDKIYAIGGEGTVALSIMEEYAPSIDTWSAKASLVTTRYMFPAAAVDGKIYAFGGYRPTISSNIEVFSPAPDLPQNPANLIATVGNAKVDLSWTAVTGATSYNVKRSTTAGGPYTTIGTSTTTTYTDTTVTNGTTYYYVVTAVNSAGESTNSNEASVKPTSLSAIQGNRAILQITMMSGLVKEYDLSAAEIDAFLKWIDDKESGVAGTKAYFTVNKTYNVKPFLTRKEYLVYSKIQDFEIKDYND